MTGIDLRPGNGLACVCMQVQITELLVGLMCATGQLLCVSRIGRSETDRDKDWSADRDEMLRVLRAYGIKDDRILAAMSKVRRHVYIPEEYRQKTNPYGDYPCPIGHGQTISQPYIVAYMTEHLEINVGEKVLEIGTGSGYQTAVLAELGADVYTIEIIPELAEQARKTLKAEGYKRTHVLTGDGYKGWPEHGPFDAIIATCAPDDVPQALVDQLKDGGRMILPTGSGAQRLMLLTKKGGRVKQNDDIFVRFVPMVHGNRI